MGVIYNGKVFFPNYLLNANLAIMVAIILYLIYVIYSIKVKKIRLIRAIINFFFGVYLTALAIVAFMPIFVFSPSNSVYHHGFGRQYIFNFSLSDLFKDSTFQIIGNVIMLAPLVYFIAILNKKYSTFKWALLLAFLASLSIETIQAIMNFFYLGDRIFDINDLILNTTGGIVGMILFKITHLIFRREIDLVEKVWLIMLLIILLLVAHIILCCQEAGQIPQLRYQVLSMINTLHY